MTYPSRNRRWESTSIRLDQKPPPQDQFRVNLHKIKSEPTSTKLDQIQPPQGQTGIHLHKNRSESTSTRLVQSPPPQGQIRVYHHYKQKQVSPPCMLYEICYHFLCMTLFIISGHILHHHTTPQISRLFSQALQWEEEEEKLLAGVIVS